MVSHSSFMPKSMFPSPLPIVVYRNINVGIFRLSDPSAVVTSDLLMSYKKTPVNYMDCQISTRKSIFTIKRHRSRQPRCFEAFGQILRQPMSHHQKSYIILSTAAYLALLDTAENLLASKFQVDQVITEINAILKMIALKNCSG